MSMLPWIYSSAGLSATVSTKSESHWIASGMASKRRRTVILNSFSAKFTTPNAAAMLKQVLLLIVIASIGVQAKSSSGKQLKINGNRIGRPNIECRKHFVRTQVALAEASAIMMFCR
jgi:hypothetical protein